MSVRVELAPRAVRDLISIVDELSERAGAKTARLWRSRLYEKMALAGERPLAFALRPELGDNRRAIVLSPYVVVYVASADRSLILRVLHGARDLPQILNE